MRTPQPPQLPRSHRYTFVQTFGITQEQPETSTNTCTPRTPQQAPSQPGACMGHKAVVVCPSQPPVWGAAGLGEARAWAEPLTQRPGPAASPRAGRGRAGRRPPGGGGGKEAGKGGREAGKEAGRRRAPALEVGGRMVSGLRGGRGGRGAAGFGPPSAWFVSPNPKTTARAQPPGAAGAAARPHGALRGPGLLHGTGLCREKGGERA